MSDLLPISATAQERALAEATARIGEIRVLVREVWDADNAPASVLAWLAWAFSVDDWETTWTDAQKRATVKDALATQKIKGTVGAVARALNALGFGVQVQEWFSQIPAGAPYTFRLLLDVDQVGILQEDLAKILQVVESHKNLRSHLDTVVPGITTKATLYSGGVSCLGSEITVGYQPPSGYVLRLDGLWWLNGEQDVDGVYGIFPPGGMFVMDGSLTMNGLQSMDGVLS